MTLVRILIWPFKVFGLFFIFALPMLIAAYCESTDTED